MSARKAGEIPEREIAIALLLELARCRGYPNFALLGFYDDDADFLEALAHRLNVSKDKAWRNKLLRVVRRLVQYGVLSAQMRGTQKEYLGEPAKQMEYAMEPGWSLRLAPDLYPHYKPMMSADREASFLIRRAYPDPEN